MVLPPLLPTTPAGGSSVGDDTVSLTGPSLWFATSPGYIRYGSRKATQEFATYNESMFLINE